MSRLELPIVSILLDSALKGFAILLIIWTAVHLLRKASAATRHTLCFLGLLSLPCLTLMGFLLPGWPVLPQCLNVRAPVQQPSSTGTPDVVPVQLTMKEVVLPGPPHSEPKTALLPVSTPVTTNRELDLGLSLQCCWLAGTGLVLLPIMLGVLSLWRLRRSATPLQDHAWTSLLNELAGNLGVTSPIHLLISSQRRMPMTWGVFRTNLLLPQEALDWPAERRRNVLLHELAHAQRHDCLVHLLTRFILAVYWFNPLAWMAARRMEIEQECACDDLVLGAGTNAPEYAEQILQIASNLPPVRTATALAIAMARPSALEGRLLAILDHQRNRNPMGPLSIIAVTLLLTGLLAPIAMLRASEGKKVLDKVMIGENTPIAVEGKDIIYDRSRGLLEGTNGVQVHGAPMFGPGNTVDFKAQRFTYNEKTGKAVAAGVEMGDKRPTPGGSLGPMMAETFEFVVPTTTNANRFQFTQPSTTNSNWKIIYNNVTSSVPRKPITPVPPTPPPTNPAPPSALIPGGNIEFAELVHDFGKVIGGEIVKWDFIFTNTGRDTLTLSEVRPSCGCTVVSAWPRTVAPGHIGIIPVELNTANFTGQLSKNIMGTCSDTNHPTINLTVKANIWRPIEVSPQWAILNVNSETPSNGTIIKILSNLEQPLNILNIDCPNAALAADLLTVQSGKEYQLVIKTMPPYPTNTLQAAIKLFTSSTNMPVIPVTAWVNYQPTITATPAKVLISPEPRIAPFTNTVWLRNSGTNLITFAQPSCNREDVKVLMNEVQQGRVYRVDLIFPAWFQMSPIEKIQLDVKTTHPGYPIIRVPIETKGAPGQIIPPSVN